MSLSHKTINNLIKKNITVSTVESCTGGLLSYSFIKNKGVSKIFQSGLVCYSNSSKIKILNINKNNIAKNGAVSQEIAKEMLNKLYNITKSDLIISTTGIAGPTGNSKYKPVGLVYIGVKYKKKLFIYKKNFNGTRIQIQKKTINYIFKKISDLI
tara:strand:- start:310 stop:774 length:465 start_codon:yes stop_codon:yes gene_type:complete